MKKIILYLTIFLMVKAFESDEKDCLNICNEKFVGTGEEKAACGYGCYGRKSIPKGKFGFQVCMKRCENKYSNETLKNYEKSCKFACSLPYEQRVSISLDFSGKEPKWTVEESNGGILKLLGLEEKSKANFPSLEDLMSPSFFERTVEKMHGKAQLLLAEKNAERINPFDDFDRIDEKSRDILKQMLNSVRSDFKEFSKGKHIFETRPSAQSSFPQGKFIGNLRDGQIIINEVDEGTSEEYIQRHFKMQLLRWILFVLIMLFLFFTGIYVIVVFKKREYFRRRAAYHSNVIGVQESEIFPTKKSMMANDFSSWQNREPEGDAPPEYDQLSIHAPSRVEQK